MTQQTDKRRKVLAILAGGLVLGVGTAAVLAAWNDSEFATGSFAAGQFNLEGSTASATDGFAEHASEGDAAELDYTLNATNLVPGDVEYASFWVRLDASTTTDGTLSATSFDADGGNAEHLDYTVTAIDAGAVCDADAAGTLMGEGSFAESGITGGSIAVFPGADDAAGEAVHLCFAVTAGSDLVQGETATATWQFTATTE